jgi:hypothetical protein
MSDSEMDSDMDNEDVILFLISESKKLEKNLARSQKYAGTLKHNIKAVAKSNDVLRLDAKSAREDAGRYKQEYNAIAQDYDTQTNSKLRQEVLHLHEMLEQLQAKHQQTRHELGQERELRLRSKKDLAESRRQCTELQVTTHKQLRITGTYKKKLEWYSKRVADYVKSGTRSLNGLKIDHTDGECVVCLEDAAIYAHPACGCLTYCQECRDLTEEHKPLHTVWKCPRCRTLNTRVVRIYNLPVRKIDEISPGKNDEH